MRLERVGDATKGWSVGPWNAALPLAIGYATAAIDEPHLHQRVTEIYLVANGESTASVESESIRLVAGDVLIVELGEAHTFIDATPDYLHFVIQTPALPEAAARADKDMVLRARLGLVAS